MRSLFLARRPVSAVPVRLGPGIRDALWQHATAARPLESCGYLVGQGERISRFVPTRNLHAEPETRYSVDPLVYLDLEDELEDAEDEVVGVFHSHPATVPEPSVTDRAHAQPGWWYLILGFPPDHPQGHLRAWHVPDADADAPFEEVEWTIQEATP